MDGTIGVVYFSPTHTTQKLVRAVAAELARQTGKQQAETNLTPSSARGKGQSFGPADVLVFGFPVYAGRVPPLVAKELSLLKGDATPAVVMAVYGNRDYDDALVEARDILAQNGFTVFAAGAFIGEHSHSFKLAANRPDESDLAAAARLGALAAEKLAAGSRAEPAIKGNRPYRELMAYSPLRPDTSDACTGCGACAAACPMGVIHADDPTAVNDGCIQCWACVKTCPVGAKAFHDEQVDRVVAVLEGKFSEPKAPEWFV